MNDLRPHGRQLIRAARRQCTPSAEDRQRNFSALMRGRARGERASLPVLASYELSTPLKLLLLLALLLFVIGGLYFASRAGSKPGVNARHPGSLHS